EVAADDALLVGVLNGPTDVGEQLEPVAHAEAGLIAELGDRDPLDQFHDEVGPAGVGRAGVEDAGDVRVVHHGQRLALGLEAGDHGPRVHAGLDALECDAALTWRLL